MENAKRNQLTRPMVRALCLGALAAMIWTTGCGGGSSGSGLSLGDGLPAGGGGGPSGGGGGGGGSVPTPTPEPACGGGTLAAVFTASTSNANVTTFNATKVRGTALIVAGAGSSFTITGTLCAPPAGGNRTVVIKVSGRLAAGTSYPVVGGSAGVNSSLQYLESTTAAGETVEKSWTATAATLEILTITGKTVTFRIRGAVLSPDPDFFTTNATGGFALNVTGSVDNVDGL